jgi:hypothetical protein
MLTDYSLLFQQNDGFTTGIGSGSNMPTWEILIDGARRQGWKE